MRKSFLFSIVILVVFYAAAFAQTGSTTKPLALQDAVIIANPLTPHFSAPMERQKSEKKADSDIGSVFLGYQKEFIWTVNPTVGEVTEPTLPSLCPERQAAVDAAPTWIKPALARKLMDLDESLAKPLALMIADPEDDRYTDELAFSVAYLSEADLMHMDDPVELLTLNARLIYEYDTLLDYVEIVEIEDPGDGNFGTTLRYNVAGTDDDVEQYEIPTDVYYWYVVHPKLSDEKADYVKPSTGNYASRDEGGLFWREYLLQDVEGEDSYHTPMYFANVDEEDLQNLTPSARGYLTNMSIHNLEIAYYEQTKDPVFVEFAYGSGTVYALTLRVGEAYATNASPLLTNLLDQGNGDILLEDGDPIALLVDSVKDISTFQDALTEIGRWDDTTLIPIADIPDTNWSQYHKVVVPSDSSLALYQAVADEKTDLESFLSGGGILQIHLDTSDANDPAGLVFPGGFETVSQADHETDEITLYGRPILLDMLSGIDILWDGVVHPDLSGDRDIWTNADALQALGNWVGKNMLDNISERWGLIGTTPERSVQPVRVAYNHFGNCGELEDIINAAMRTCLIAGLSITDINEDHVWNEFYHDGNWYYFQNDWSNGATRVATPGGGQDVDYGGGKDTSFLLAWRGDGMIESASPRYSNTITIEVELTDSNGAPVPDALVEIYSEGWQTTQQYIGYWVRTDPSGYASVLVGDKRNYYARVLSSIGEYPEQPGKSKRIPPTLEQIVAADDAVADATFTFQHQFETPLINYTLDESENLNDSFALHIQFNATHRYGTIYNEYSGVYANPSIDTPLLDVFLVDEDNLEAATNNEEFTAAAAWTGVASLDELVYPPTDADWSLLVTRHSAPFSDHLLDITVTAEGDPWVPPADDDDAADDAAGGDDDDDDDDSACCGC